MKKSELNGKIENYLYQRLNDEEDYEVKEYQAIDLLTIKRFDVLAKYIYAKSKISGKGMEWAEFVYKEHLRSLNHFTEKNNQKNSFGDFKIAFDSLIESMREKGFDGSRSLLPIGRDGSPINGAHRLAVSLALNCVVKTIKIPIDTFSYDYAYLKQGKAMDSIMDFMALEYAKLKKNFHTAILFPIALDKKNEVEGILAKYGVIFYQKSLGFNRNGIHNLVLQIYRDHEWNKNDKDFSRTMWHSYNRYVAGKPTTVYFVESTSLEQMLQAKKEVRELFNLGNSPIHISDDDEESVRVSEQVLNKNSIHFFNNAKIGSSIRYDNLFTDFKNWIEHQAYNKDDFCISGSSTMAVYGMRDAKDLDFISHSSVECDVPSINSHNSHVSQFLDNLDKILFDPENHFYFDGCKFLSLVNLKTIKNKRNELKDKVDIRLINPLLNSNFGISSISNKLAYLYYVSIGHTVHFFRNNTPKPIFPYVRKAYKILKR